MSNPNNEGNKIRVLLADDHVLVRQGFRRLLEDDPKIEVVGEAGTGVAAIELCKTLKPEVVVMDLSMPEVGGLEAMAEILKESPEIKVLILSMYSNENYVRKAFEIGARGYMLKDAIEIDLTRAISALAAGESYMSPGISNMVIQGLKTGSFQDPTKDSYERLTLREKEIMLLIVQGNSNKEIAGLLEISSNTVAVHRARIMDTLGLRRTAELVLFAVKKGLIQPQ